MIDSSKIVNSFNVLFTDFVEGILANADNPGKCSEHIAAKIRDLIGVKTVLVFECHHFAPSPEKHHRLLSVIPERRRSLADSDEIQLLCELSHDMSNSVIIRPGIDRSSAAGILQELGVNDSIVLPVQTGNKRVGVIFLLDVMDMRGIGDILSMLDKLSSIVALVIRNASLYTNLEQEVTVRTREIVRAMKAAEAANKAKSEFLANMSHEIRTPLNGILGMLQLLQTTSPNDEQKEYIYAGVKSAKRLTRLLSDILDLSRVEAGKMLLRDEVFELAALKESILDLFSVAAKDKKLTLEFMIDGNIPPRLTGDETRLRQILFNLVGNALKFTEHGRVTVEMSLASKPDVTPFRILFCVSDTGIGIPENRLRDVFEPFTQVDGSYVRNYQGAGLGLAIVRRIVNLMGGSIVIESMQGKGTSVNVVLPFLLPNEEDTTATTLKGSKTAHISANKQILLVEDDHVNRIAVKCMLEKAGYAVTCASDGQEALQRVSEKKFDLVLMDIQMPVMDGVEATKRIRTQSRAKTSTDVPIVAMTAYAMSGDREKLLGLGMNDYIAKPVDMNDLLQTIGDCLK